MLVKLTLSLAAVVLASAFALGPPPSTSAGPNCSADASIDAVEQQLVDLINDHRADNGLPPLAISATLSRSASWKSHDMAGNDYFAHDDVPIGRSFLDRIRDCGYTHNTWIGENIAAGNEGAQATFNQWRDSAGHNANMLSTNYTAIGIGRAYDAGSTYRWYWTAEFGGVADGAPPPASIPAGVGDVNCTNTIDSVDALLVLQLAAALLSSLPCASQADVDGDGTVGAMDAALILQVAAGMIGVG